MATFTRQYILAMSRATYLADHSAARSSYFGELATMTALMVCFQRLLHDHHALLMNSRYQGP